MPNEKCQLWMASSRIVPDVRALACVGRASVNEPGASGAAPPCLHLRASPYLMETDVSCCYYTYT